jgi:alpha-amylase
MVTEYLNSKELVLVFNGKKSLHQFIKSEDNGFVSSNNAIVFIDNHDNQRMFVEGFNEILNYKDKRRYLLANIFLLAYPYGLAKIMSSFKFNQVYDGPPMAANHMIMSPIFDKQNQCVNGWICEHRWPIILSMVKFRNVVGKSPLANYADNGQNQIAFCRGELGFIAMNNEISLNMKSYLKACVPPGTYCDIITGELIDGNCTGDEIVVDQDGKVNIFIPWTKEIPVVAFHVKSRKN